MVAHMSFDLLMELIVCLTTQWGTTSLIRDMSFFYYCWLWTYIVKTASLHIFFQKILSFDGCMWMCVDRQRLVHLFASLAIFTSGKERLLEVERKTQQAGQLLEGGQLASAPSSLKLSSAQLRRSIRLDINREKGMREEQEQAELKLYSICDIY